HGAGLVAVPAIPGGRRIVPEPRVHPELAAVRRVRRVPVVAPAARRRRGRVHRGEGGGDRGGGGRTGVGAARGRLRGGGRQCVWLRAACRGRGGVGVRTGVRAVRITERSVPVAGPGGRSGARRVQPLPRRARRTDEAMSDLSTEGVVAEGVGRLLLAYRIVAYVVRSEEHTSEL